MFFKKSKYPDVTAHEVEELLRSGAIALDIRTPEEFERSHIVGALLIDFYSDDFRDEIEKLDASENYVVLCEAGGRSKKALELFEVLGFERVFHYKGGMRDWRQKELPTE